MVVDMPNVHAFTEQTRCCKCLFKTSRQQMNAIVRCEIQAWTPFTLSKEYWWKHYCSSYLENNTFGGTIAWVLLSSWKCKTSKSQTASLFDEDIWTVIIKWDQNILTDHMS